MTDPAALVVEKLESGAWLSTSGTTFTWRGLVQYLRVGVTSADSEIDIDSYFVDVEPTDMLTIKEEMVAQPR